MSNKRKHENQLQAAFDFADEDLQYNRELEASPTQYRRYGSPLLPVQTSPTATGYIAFALFISIGALLILWGSTYLALVLMRFIQAARQLD